MAGIAQTELHDVVYVPEVNYGEDPGSGYKELWHNSPSLQHVRTSLQGRR